MLMISEITFLTNLGVPDHTNMNSMNQIYVSIDV